MQNFKEFFTKTIIFLPAVIILTINPLWIGFAVGAQNPISAINRLKHTSVQDESSGGKNPFRDFSFDSLIKKESRVSAPVQSEAISPHYNVVKEFFTSAESDIVLKKDSCYVKNLTRLPAGEVKEIMLSPISFKAEKNSSDPQILIMHTHATESYVPTADMPYNSGYAFRNTDTSQNMVAVGKVMADTLNSLGYNTIQDSTLHDYPSYNGSYDKSRDTVEYYLKKYPSIKIVLDVHRDAVERGGRIISPVTTIDGTEYAQIMIISGRDNGYMNMPNYRENLKFASRVQNRLSKSYSGIARPVLFDYRNYNQQLTTGSILVEVGTHGSTLTRAKNSRRAFGESLAKALDNM